MTALWAMLRADAWRTGSVHLNLGRFRAGLGAYYKRLERRGVVVTRVQYVTNKMIGTSARLARQPFKGAEAKGLIEYFNELLRDLMPDPQGQLLLVAGVHLRRLVHLFDTCPLNPSAAEKQEM